MGGYEIAAEYKRKQESGKENRAVFYEREDGDGRWGDMDGRDTLKGEQNLSIS